MTGLRRLFSVWNLILLAALAVLFLLVVYPMFSIFQASFLDTDTSVFTWANYKRLFTSRFYLRCLGNSLLVSGLSTLFSLVIGVPFAFLTTRVRLPGATLLKTLATLPLILPTFVGAEAWLLLLGRSGMLTRFLHGLGLQAPSIHGWAGVVLVFTLQFFPFVFLMVAGAINSIDASLEEAARNLGAGTWRVFRTVTLPVVTPAIAAGGLIVFCMSIENFGVPTIIGDGFKVLAEQAYSEFVSEMGGNPSMAGALSMALVLITLVLTVAQKLWVERRNYTMSSLRPPAPKQLGRAGTWAAFTACAGVVFVSLFPFLLILVAAVTRTKGPVMYYGQFSLDNLLAAFQVAPPAHPELLLPVHGRHPGGHGLRPGRELPGGTAQGAGGLRPGPGHAPAPGHRRVGAGHCPGRHLQQGPHRAHRHLDDPGPGLFHPQGPLFGEDHLGPGCTRSTPRWRRPPSAWACPRSNPSSRW